MKWDMVIFIIVGIYVNFHSLIKMRTAIAIPEVCSSIFNLGIMTIVIRWRYFIDWIFSLSTNTSADSIYIDTGVFLLILCCLQCAIQFSSWNFQSHNLVRSKRCRVFFFFRHFNIWNCLMFGYPERIRWTFRRNAATWKPFPQKEQSKLKKKKSFGT